MNLEFAIGEYGDCDGSTLVASGVIVVVHRQASMLLLVVALNSRMEKLDYIEP